MSQQKKTNSKGFSLVEMLVVIFISALLSTLIIVNYRAGQEKYNLGQAAQQLASDIRRIQNSALTGRIQGADTPVGYGIYIKSVTQYKLFYNSTLIPPAWAERYKETGSPSSINIDIINLSSGLTFNAGSVGHCVFFAPPDPTTFIDGDIGPPITFTLCPSSCSPCPGGCSNNKTITVDIGGRIDIQ